MTFAAATWRRYYYKRGRSNVHYYSNYFFLRLYISKEMLGFPKLKIQRGPATGDLLGENETKRAAALGARFGLTRILKAQEDLVGTIVNPVEAQKKWAADIGTMEKTLGKEYKDMYDKFIAEIGLTPEEATEVADAWISKSLENWRMFLALKYPYSFGGEEGDDPIKNLKKLNSIDLRAEAAHRAAKMLE
jgi:hypothetical protein